MNEDYTKYLLQDSKDNANELLKELKDWAKKATNMYSDRYPIKKMINPDQPHEQQSGNKEKM